MYTFFQVVALTTVIILLIGTPFIAHWKAGNYLKGLVASVFLPVPILFIIALIESAFDGYFDPWAVLAIIFFMIWELLLSSLVGIGFVIYRRYEDEERRSNDGVK